MSWIVNLHFRLKHQRLVKEDTVTFTVAYEEDCLSESLKINNNNLK